MMSLEFGWILACVTRRIILKSWLTKAHGGIALAWTLGSPKTLTYQMSFLLHFFGQLMIEHMVDFEMCLQESSTLRVLSFPYQMTVRSYPWPTSSRVLKLPIHIFLFGPLFRNLDFNDPRRFAFWTPTYTFVAWDDSTYKLLQFLNHCLCHCSFQPPSSSTFRNQKLCCVKII